MDDETIRLILDMGASGATVEDVTKRLEGLKGSVRTTADTYEVLERQVGEYEVLERRVVETTRTVVQAQAQQVDILQQLGIQTQIAAASAAKVGQSLGSGGDFGRGVMQASFAIQDFTSVIGTQGLGRAIGAVQNNIPILITSLGAGAGLAGVVSIVSVGVGLLIDNWGKLTGAWKDEDTKKEAERMKDLAKATEQAAEAAEKLSKTLPRAQTEEANAVQKAIKEFGGRAVMDELSKALQARFGDFGKEANEAQAKTFMANAARGDGKAIELLRDLDLRGDIGEVLRGGKTPTERFAAARQADARQAKEAEQAAKERKEQAEKDRKDAEKKKEEQAAEDRAADLRTEAMQRRIADRGRREAAQAANARRRAAGRPARSDVDLHAISEAGGLPAVQQMQQAVQQQTGQAMSLTDAARMILRERQQVQAAQREFLDAVMGAMNGQNEQAAMFRNAARQVRQRQQPAAQMGWGGG